MHTQKDPFFNLKKICLFTKEPRKNSLNNYLSLISGNQYNFVLKDSMDSKAESLF